MTRDVVIKGLECITDTTRKPKRCEECVYNDGIHSGLYTCMPIRIVLDALALLKQTEIVRCKSCRQYNTECCADGFGWCHRRDFGTTDEWYCADGEEGTYDEG